MVSYSFLRLASNRLFLHFVVSSLSLLLLLYIKSWIFAWFTLINDIKTTFLWIPKCSIIEFRPWRRIQGGASDSKLLLCSRIWVGQAQFRVNPKYYRSQTEGPTLQECDQFDFNFCMLGSPCPYGFVLLSWVGFESSLPGFAAPSSLSLAEHWWSMKVF